jgi:hypothetical protein
LKKEAAFGWNAGSWNFSMTSDDDSKDSRGLFFVLSLIHCIIAGELRIK